MTPIDDLATHRCEMFRHPGTGRVLPWYFKVDNEIVDVARNAQVWSKAYDVTPAEFPKLQAQVLGDVVRALRIPLTSADGTALTRKPTDDSHAYQHLQGRYLWNQRSEASLQSAVVQFRRVASPGARFARLHQDLLRLGLGGLRVDSLWQWRA